MGVKVTEWNNNRGEIQIHKAGCADVAKKKHAHTYETETFREIVEAVYPPFDFDYDADTEWRNFAGDIRLMPCCPSIPDEATVDAPQTAVDASTTTNGVRGTRIDHRGHGHELTPAARAVCRRFMATHDGMDEVTYRVAQREAEIDDAFGDDEADD